RAKTDKQDFIGKFEHFVVCRRASRSYPGLQPWNRTGLASTNDLRYRRDDGCQATGTTECLRFVSVWSIERPLPTILRLARGVGYLDRGERQTRLQVRLRQTTTRSHDEPEVAARPLCAAADCRPTGGRMILRMPPEWLRPEEA